MKILFIVASCLLLAACESTSFQAPPVAEIACDPALAGRWIAPESEEKNSDDVELRIDAACRLLFIDHDNGVRNEGEPVQAHLGVDGDAHYLWVDAAWAAKRFDAKQPPPVGDLFVLRYLLTQDSLTLEMPDNRAVAHRIIDNKINGEVRRYDGVLANRLLAPIDAKALREPGFFTSEPARFQRAATEIK